MVEVMQKDYIRTARSKGLKSRSVVVRHALKNGLLPTITQLGLLVGWAMSGSILVENIFSWGGLGTYAWIGINRLDLPVILGITLLTTLVFVIINLIVDVSYGFLDPRINLQ
jgi:peptide/nickel transport system permease protein